jgi:hypothetical protein
MKLQLLRINSQEDYTSGILFQVCDDGSKEFLCYTLEDEYRAEKVKHETRIPAGTYEMALRKVGGFHQRYEKRFNDIHKGMLELIGVPNFQYILIHCGNTDEHTSGCILVGQTQEYGKKDGWIGRSTQAYFDIYPMIAQALEDGEDVQIEVIDYENGN